MSKNHRPQMRDVASGLRRSVFTAAVAGLLLGGCAGGEDFAYTEISEIPEGQGLVSGPEGEFTLLKYDPSQRTASNYDVTTLSPAPSQSTATSGGGTGTQALEQ